jgi:hypothetical protein
MIDRSKGGTSLPDGSEGPPGEIPAWFQEAVRACYYKLEYGQKFTDAAPELWRIIQSHTSL